VELIIRPVDPSSPAYEEFARLHRIVCDMRPGHRSHWNGELYTFDGDPLGGYDTETGRMLLSRQLVLDQFAGPPSDAQAEALATVLHESYHATAEFDSDDPDAVHSRAAIALDEGLTERRTRNDFPVFAKRAGYQGLSLDTNQYEGAVAAVDRLIDYAAGPDHADALNRTALSKPVPLQWDTIAHAVVRTHLSDVVPDGHPHQRAARASMVAAMTNNAWGGIEYQPEHHGQLLAKATLHSLNEAVERVRAAATIDPETSRAAQAAFAGLSPHQLPHPTVAARRPTAPSRPDRLPGLNPRLSTGPRSRHPGAD
jgi:hypothetical protein